LNYYITSQDYQRNVAMMESHKYKQMQQLLSDQRRIRSELTEVQKERERLPFDDSRLAGHLEVLQVRLFSGTAVNSISYDAESKNFRVEVTTDDLDKFIKAKNDLNAESEYWVSIPVT